MLCRENANPSQELLSPDREISELAGIVDSKSFFTAGEELSTIRL